MFSSLKTKIIFFIALVMVATAVTVLYFTYRDVGHAMSQAEEASAKNVLRLVELNIQGGYQNLLADRIGAMAQRKSGLKTQAGVAASVLEQFAVLASKRLISKKNAQKMGLNWLKSVSSMENEILFVFDEKGMVIAHPDGAVEYTSIGSLRDMKGRSISRAMSATSLTAGGDFAVFDWENRDRRWVAENWGILSPFRSGNGPWRL